MIILKIFVLFSRVALFSWGGGPASLALMQREVTTAGWASSAEFADAVVKNLGKKPEQLKPALYGMEQKGLIHNN
jgi:hypothetical protein